MIVFAGGIVRIYCGENSPRQNLSNHEKER
jgi:hypothetical protein